MEAETARLEAALASAIARISDLETLVGRSGVGDIGHPRAHGFDDHSQIAGLTMMKTPAANQWCLPGWSGYTSTTVAHAAGTLYYTPMYVDHYVTFNAIGSYVSLAAAAGKLMRIAIYTDNLGTPASLVQDFGTIAVDATGTKTITSTYSLRGRYWTAEVTDGTPTMTGIDESAAACVPAATPLCGSSPSTNPVFAILTVTGQTGLVSSGFPATAVAPAGRAGTDLAAVRLRYS